MGKFNATKEGICGECGEKISVGDEIRGPYFIGGKRTYFGTSCHKDARSKKQKSKDTSAMLSRQEQYKKDNPAKYPEYHAKLEADKAAKEAKAKAKAAPPKEEAPKKEMTAAQTKTLKALAKAKGLDEQVVFDLFG